MGFKATLNNSGIWQGMAPDPASIKVGLHRSCGGFTFGGMQVGCASRSSSGSSCDGGQRIGVGRDPEPGQRLVLG